ncbi:MAG: Ig-like domain-containing protein [Deltaproteobacteria bacterium]|nr:Ig-like domain-containing protein [Deltaproteobacteria bacterium]
MIGLIGAALGAGCVGSAPEPVPPGPTLEVMSGADQSAEIGSTLALPFVAIVKDGTHAPMAGVTVTFEVESGGGSLSDTSVTTDELGQAETTLTLGATAGANAVTVSAPGVARSPIKFTALANAPTSVMFATHVKPILDANCVGCHQAGGAAPGTPLTSYALVRYGKSSAGDAALVVPGSPESSVLAQKVQATGSMYASLGPDVATRNANAKTISDWIAAGALNTGVGAASKVALVSGDNQSATVSTALPTPLVVRVMDADDNAVSDVWVDFAIGAGGGKLSALAVKTDAQGEARSNFDVGAVAGQHSVTASVQGVATSITFASTATAGTATQIALVSGNNQTRTAGTQLQNPLVVAVKDAAGNPVAGFMVTFTAATGGGTLSTQPIATNAQGQAQTTLTVGTMAGTNTVTANATGLTGSPITFTATGTAGAAAQLAIVSGNNQSVRVGAALTMPFVVAVKDANGNPVSGTAVSFTVASGGGSLSAASVMTNATGQAQTTLTLGPTAGTNTVTATRAGLTGSPITFTATGTTGTATQIALVSGTNQSATAGTTLSMPLVVVVKDANGNPVDGFSVSFNVASGGGMLSAASAMTNAQGQAQTTLTLGSMAGANIVTANATGLTGSPVTFTATGTGGTPTQLLLVSGTNQTAKVGTALSNPFVVQLKDNNGNPVAGFAITFTVTGGGGTVSATSVTTNAMGLAQATLTLGTTVGTNNVSASRSGLVPVNFTATATSGTATQIAISSGNNQSATAGSALINPVVVVVKDANGNPVGGFAVTFAVGTGGGTVSTTSTTTNAQGLAQTTLTLGTTAGTNTVTVNATGLTGSPITFTATATAGAASQLVVVSGNNQSGRVGAALAAPLVIAVKDAKGNPVPGIAVTFAVASGGGSLSATTATSNSMGQAQTTLTVGTAAGTNTVTASSSGLTSVTFTETARWLTYTDDVQPILVARCVSCHMSGGQYSATPLTTYTQVRYGTSFSSGAALVVPNSPSTSVLAQKTQSTGSMYANLGPDTATRDASSKTISDWIAQGSLNTAVGTANQIVMTSGNNQSGSVTTVLTNPFVVTVMDANMNPVSGVTVMFAVTAGGGSLSATSVATNAQGTASSKLTLGATAGTNTVTASVTGLTNSPITFTATSTAGSYSGVPLAGSTNPFDTAALVALKAANVEPAALSSDGEFLRRVTADLAGRLPTLDERTTFAASIDPAKRDKVIDTLLASSDFGKHWGLDILAAWLVVDKRDGNATATDIANFESYLVDAATNDKPLSTVVSELAQGTGTGGAAFDVFNMDNGERYKAADRLMETFTGIPSKCARCHDSKITGPLDDPKWTLAQSHGLYKFFEVDAGEFNYYDPAQSKYVNPTMMFVVDGASTNPTNLPQPTDTLAVRRQRFAALLVASRAFPRGTGHRIFAEVMQPLLDSNRVLAQQLADVKVPEVLKASTSVFTSQGTSLKGYLRILMRSKLYQLTTKGTTTTNDAILARHPLRRHAAEVLQAGIVAATGVADSTSARDDFLSKFGYATERSAITQRSFAINTIQPLTLLNNPSSAPGKVTQSTGIVAGLATKVDGGTLTLDAAITEIFRRALTRDPTATELTSLKNEIATATTTKEKLEDVAVVVMASTEFSTR